MNEAHMRKAYLIFQKAGEKMIKAGVDPVDVSAALVGVGAAISVDCDGANSTGNWLKDVGEKLTSDKPPMPIN